MRFVSAPMNNCGNGIRRILSIRKRNKAASLEDAKKERMHRCQRIKWSRSMSEQKVNKNRSWSSYCRKEPGSCYRHNRDI
jgi:hypothetical protein